MWSRGDGDGEQSVREKITEKKKLQAATDSFCCTEWIQRASHFFPLLRLREREKANIVTTDCTNCNAVEMLEVLAVFPLVHPENIDQQLTFYLLTRATTPSRQPHNSSSKNFQNTIFQFCPRSLHGKEESHGRTLSNLSKNIARNKFKKYICHHFAGGHWLALPSFTFTPDRSLIKTSKWNIQWKWEEKVLRSLPVCPRSPMHFYRSTLNANIIMIAISRIVPHCSRLLQLAIFMVPVIIYSFPFHVVAHIFKLSCCSLCFRFWKFYLSFHLTDEKKVLRPHSIARCNNFGQKQRAMCTGSIEKIFENGCFCLFTILCIVSSCFPRSFALIFFAVRFHSSIFWPSRTMRKTASYFFLAKFTTAKTGIY